jgi:hypothetical protein
VGEANNVVATFVNDAFCLIKFNSGTTWTVPTGVTAIDVLLVGGGGGGGADGGGGGGGGGVGSASGLATTAGSVVTITVGSGGTAASHTPPIAGSAGGTSSVILGGTTYSASGGTNGVGYQSAESLAARGGVSANVTAVTGATDYSKGGRNSYQTTGGVGTVGFDGVTTSFTGSSVIYAGGGGGGTCAPGNTAPNKAGLAGGAGGGGRGSQHIQNVGSDAGQAGTNGLGGGGGGGSACDDGPGNVYGTYQRTAGGRGGDGVVYIKFVPVVAISLSPQSTTGTVGSTVTFLAAPNSALTGAGYSRAKKWQLSTDFGATWTDISGATADSYTTPTITRSMHQYRYRYVVTDSVGTAVSTTNSAAAVLSVPAPLLLGETDTAMTASGTTYANTTVAGADSLTPTSSDSFTIEAWIYPTNACAATRCTIAAREGAFRFTYLANKISFVFWNGGSAPWQNDTYGSIPLNQWSHVAITKNGSTYKTFINGSLFNTYTLTYAPNSGLTSSFFVGSINTTGNEYFIGSIDELKVWKTDRSSSISGDMNSNENAVSGLVGYWNFNEGKETTSYNQVLSAPSGTDLTMGNANYWDSTLISTTTVFNPYTIRKFMRSYITALGGWKVPDSITAVSALAVGGGGGGGYNSGGGGSGGGVTYIPSLSIRDTLTVIVGQGGFGANSSGSTPKAGFSTTVHSVTSPGGNPGGNYPTSQLGGTAVSTSSGSWGAGGRGAPNNSTSGTAGSSGATYSIETSSVTYGGGGGGGGWGGNTGGGDGGAGGGGAGGITNSQTGKNGSVNLGGGGGGGSASGVAAGNGGSGVVIIRWITALKPTFTKPTNSYLNVGMTETFTTNVAVDSATVGLTRTFRWESTTPTSGGIYSVVKQGTGAANASFSWVPPDTSTSGSGYLYRVIVTDSDTAGLFIVDTSTPVFAVINRALVVSGNSGIAKTINLAKSETFTITLGTSTYRTTLTTNNPGISLDTSTATSPVVKISETMTVGTYYETLTVTDSVSATIIIPLTIKVKSAPSLSNSAELIESGTVLNLDASNSNSYPFSGSTWNDLSGRKLSATFEKTFTASATYMDGSTRASNWLQVQGVTCTTPTYSKQYSGVLEFNGTGNCGLVQNVRAQTNYTLQTWIKRNGDQSANAAIVANLYQNTSDHIRLALYWTGASTLVAGLYNGSGWSNTTAITVANDVWTYISLTFDGTNLRMYANDQTGTSYPLTLGSNFSLTPSVNATDLIIGAKWDDRVYFKGSIASIQMYNRVLSSSEIIQNYSATRTRFLTENQNQLNLSQKYGVLTLESFTATSGGDTKTVTLSAAPRQGVVWDATSTPGQIKLSVGESLTVGTYYDTVTVTDNFGASTYLPLTFTVTKADTITVTSGPSLTTVYSGSAPTNGPVARITGLVGKDTATVLTRYETSTVGKTCATGGTCRIGDTGPGGGVVFYVSDTPINKADGISDGGIYLEMHTTSINVNNWSSDPTSVPGTSAAIGSGAENTRRAFTQLGSNSSLMTTIANGTYGGKSDWFVPSLNEAMTMVSTLRNLGLGSFGDQNLWTSTESTNSANAEHVWSANPPVTSPLPKSGGYTVRPIRAFGGTTITPTEVDTYTALGTNINFSIGALSNYQAVVYETSTLKITQASQAKLTVNLYGAVAGQSFLLQISGGSGSGTVTETITSGSTATNCTITNRVLSNSNLAGDQKMCNIRITKAASRNYLSATLDATVYFMAFVNNQPTNQVGSGSTIGLNGMNQVWTDPGTAPTITLFPSNATRNTEILIEGSGFTAPGLVVEFEFYQQASSVTITDDSHIKVIVPNSATTGPIVITNKYGTAFSTTNITIG